MDNNIHAAVSVYFVHNTGLDFHVARWSHTQETLLVITAKWEQRSFAGYAWYISGQSWLLTVCVCVSFRRPTLVVAMEGADRVHARASITAPRRVTAQSVGSWNRHVKTVTPGEPPPPLLLPLPPPPPPPPPKKEKKKEAKSFLLVSQRFVGLAECLWDWSAGCKTCCSGRCKTCRTHDVISASEGFAVLAAKRERVSI